MAETVDYEALLVRGVGEALAAETYLSWVDPDANEAYPADVTGIYLGNLPAEPPVAVALTPYTVQMFPDTIVGVQVMVAAHDVENLTRASQAVADVLEGRWGGMLGTVKLVASAWQSGTPMGQDANGRQRRTDNYYLKIARTIPHRE